MHDTGRPLAAATALISLTMMSPSLAYAQDVQEDDERHLERKGVSLGARGNTTAGQLSVLQLGGLGGIGGSFIPEFITVGLPVGESGWRIEPGLGAGFSTGGSFFGDGTQRNVSASATVMAQRVMFVHDRGFLYAGVALSGSALWSEISMDNQTNNDAAFGFAAQPLVGAQVMVSEAVGAGFEIGPVLTYSPARTTFIGEEELDMPSSTSMYTSTNLTLRYYF